MQKGSKLTGRNEGSPSGRIDAYHDMRTTSHDLTGRAVAMVVRITMFGVV